MAEAAVECLLQNLQQLLIHHANLIRGVKDQVANLEKDLWLFKAFLKDTTKERRKDETFGELVRQISDVVYEADDIIDSLVTQAVESKSRNCFLRAFRKPVKLHGIAQQVAAVSHKVRIIYEANSRIDFANLSMGDGGNPEETAVPQIRQVNVVGFEDEAKKLIGYLTERTEELDVITIIGMPGLGKTTLAGMIFRDQDVQFEFPIRIWVYVSSEFTRKDVFLAILKQLRTNLSDDMYQKSDVELADAVAAELERGKFLIVMDDMWTAEDWNKLKIALPINNNIGKVLITSRQEEVGKCANHNRDPHKLRFLTHEESCLLLCLEALGKHQFPKELEVLGKVIAYKCDGLPLLLMVIGGILAKQNSASLEARRNAWEKVSKSVSAYLNEDPWGPMERIITLSYQKLPYQLKACFLYLGMFPEGFEIPVWKLIRMWIAEGFIQQMSGISLEETAYNYLGDLVNRNLVRISKVTSDGRVKMCQIHGIFSDFCKTIAGYQRENFLQEMKFGVMGFVPSISSVYKFRRLCIHSNVINFISSEPHGFRVRSFTCYSKEELTLPNDDVSTIPIAFRLLRVLDVKPIKFNRISSELFQLFHLRYIHLSFNLDKLPLGFSKFWNMQTLIVDTTSRTLEIKADIWQMIQLRHLKTNSSATLPKVRRSSKGGKKLQTLGTISPQSCTDEVFYRASNLKKLGIRGQLALLLGGKNIGSFDSLGKLENLEKLKLVNDVVMGASLDGQLGGLPPPYKFPPKLRRLTLCKTYLHWNNISILGLLDYLVVLKLKDNAFMGKTWEAIDGGFRCLEVLHIDRTDLGIWIGSGHHYPRLRCLELHNCEKLCEIPIGLADIPTFQLLDLYNTQYAVASAQQICVAKQKKLQDEQTATASGFKLSIFPLE